MPSKAAARRAEQRKREGKAPTTQAGEFVREEMHHAKEGRHSAGNPKQAIAIGLSEARRAGVDLKPPKKGKASAATRKKAERDYERGESNRAKPAAKRTASTAKRTSAAAKRTATSSKRGARKSTAGAHSTTAHKAAPRKAATKTARKKTSAGRAPAKRAAARKSR
ncbi:MAG TPA: DUF6496 domain-containing protein [Bryobacteraceae bacterium]|nr:DUF6496 domain-containing protein [Bryobacteraceae bacterium]